MAYTVAAGDTLSAIAKKLGVSLSALEAANSGIANFNVIKPGQSINVPGQSAPAATGIDPNSQQYQTALSEYGAVATFAQSNGEVNAVLQQAINGQWDAARFERELWKTGWYKSLTDNQRQMEVQQSTDPATYQQNIKAKADAITNMANGLGITVDASALAQQALWGGWDDQTLQRTIADSGGLSTPNGAYTAQAGDVQNHIKSTFASYGLPITDATVQQYVKDVLAGRQTTGGLDNQAIALASKMYPQYAEDFTEGRSLSDVAQPLIQQMGNTLEIDPSSINLTDPTIQKALQGDGKTPTTLYQFTQQLKADPRWGKTDNAKNSAYDTLAQIGKDFGFTG